MSAVLYSSLVTVTTFTSPNDVNWYNCTKTLFLTSARPQFLVSRYTPLRRFGLSMVSANPNAGFLKAEDVRAQFIDYFVKKHNHTFWASSPVVPHNDPTLLFINAGMNQFKPIFLGNVDQNLPFAVLKRAVNSQKCIRAGGKHNDLEDVGKDVYHHTFFEMLGNWSFGDYFKEQAIGWAWDLLTNVWKLPADRLYATYFGGDPKEPNIPVDDEARQIWLRYLPESRVLPFSCEDNFWEMGDTGPCGPCSEIHFDRIGQGRDASSLVNQDDPDVLEIWNLVFMQFNREKDGSLTMLPAPCVDTGMGLERVTSILQMKRSNYDTDVFSHIFKAIQKVIPQLRSYEGKVGKADTDGIDTAYRVVADHIRTLTIAISDGAIPSNEGRGYVLRRILRRAVRYGRQFLGASKDKPWFYELVDSVVELLSISFPELAKDPDHVKSILRAEETQFSRTLDKGVNLFNQTVAKLQKEAASNSSTSRPLVVPGKAAFELYTTYGFPLDLTQLMAEERGIKVDVEGFQAAFEAHQKVSEHHGFKLKDMLALNPDALNELEHKAEATKDRLKYAWVSATGDAVDSFATIKAIWDGHAFLPAVVGSATRFLGVVLDATSFYAESGGQVADIGTFLYAKEDSVSSIAFQVTDVRKVGKFVFHLGYASDALKVSDRVKLSVDLQRRVKIAKNHTATHILNFALRRVLGNDCDQKGSLVEPTRARFDYSGNRALTDAEISQIESVALSVIDEARPVFMTDTPLDKAKTIPGLRAVFGEVYPDPVRVVSVGSAVENLLNGDANGTLTSVEFCGGTHVQNTREIQDFVILLDESISRGVRRLTVATGSEAQQARTYAADLEHRFQEAQRGGSTADAGADVTSLKLELQQKKDSLPLLARKKCTEYLDALNRQQAALVKEKAKLMKKAAEVLGRSLAEQYHDAPYCTHKTAAAFSGDFKALEIVITHFNAQANNTPVLLVSQSSSGVVALASVPKSQTIHWSAKDWVAAALVPLGGKAGGKAETARGSAVAADATRAEFDAAVCAEAYAVRIRTASKTTDHE